MIGSHFKKTTTKIVVPEFDVCHKFVDDLVRNCSNIGCQITHNVSCDDFIIFLDYNDSSARLINNVVTYILKKIYADKLDLYHWKIYRPL